MTRHDATVVFIKQTLMMRISMGSLSFEIAELMKNSVVGKNEGTQKPLDPFRGTNGKQKVCRSENSCYVNDKIPHQLAIWKYTRSRKSK